MYAQLPINQLEDVVKLWQHQIVDFKNKQQSLPYFVSMYGEINQNIEKTKRIRIYSILEFYLLYHYGDVIMGVLASQITNLTIVYSTIISGTDQRKHQSSE